jgi:PAS domain S-box-containing protein
LSAHLYRELLEGSIEGVYILDEEGLILTTNQAMAEMFGYARPEDLIGQPGTILVAPPERERLGRYYAARVRGEHAPRRHTFEAVRRDGSRLWIESLVSIISWKSGRAVLVTLLDVTQRSRAEEAERRAEALRTVAQLASATAHEINNPLAVIMGNCELLAREVEVGSQRRVEAMLAAVERIRKIVIHMSHITRLELAYHSPNLPLMLDLQKSSGEPGSGEATGPGPLSHPAPKQSPSN